MYNTIWLVNRSLSFYLISWQHEFSNRKKSGFREGVSDVNKSMCKNILLVICACEHHLWFVHLPNWQFSLQPPPLQRPSICEVENFQHLRFGSILTSSQERVKQKSMFTFTFTLCTIYEVNGTDRYLEMCWPATNNFFFTR